MLRKRNPEESSVKIMFQNIRDQKKKITPTHLAKTSEIDSITSFMLNQHWEHSYNYSINETKFKCCNNCADSETKYTTTKSQVGKINLKKLLWEIYPFREK